MIYDTMAFVSESNEDIIALLKLPPSFSQTHTAIHLQYNKKFDDALMLWLGLRNYQEAHGIFMKHIACLYFGSKEAIRHIKPRDSSLRKGGER